MKSLRPASANQTRKPSGTLLVRSYLDLQRLRDEIRKAEAQCPPRNSKRPPDWKQLTVETLRNTAPR